MNSDRPTDNQAVYQITLRGALDENWSSWLSDFLVVPGHETTTITGAIADQSALRGMLCRIWDLNLEIISVIRVADVAAAGGHL